MNRELLQQALDALEAEAAIYMDNDSEDGPPEAMTDAIRTLRAELAKPEPEPIGFYRGVSQAEYESMTPKQKAFMDAFS
jgi:hypothetical protein